MKKFESPEMEIVRFAVEDIVASSGREDELPLSYDITGRSFPIIEVN